MQVDGGDAQPLPDENQEFFCGDTVAPDVSYFGARRFGDIMGVVK